MTHSEYIAAGAYKGALCCEKGHVLEECGLALALESVSSIDRGSAMDTSIVDI